MTTILHNDKFEDIQKNLKLFCRLGYYFNFVVFFFNLKDFIMLGLKNIFVVIE